MEIGGKECLLSRLCPEGRDLNSVIHHLYDSYLCYLTPVYLAINIYSVKETVIDWSLTKSLHSSGFL